VGGQTSTPAPQVAGRFEEELRMYKAPPPEIDSEQF
jgi:hypothetical protein